MHVLGFRARQNTEYNSRQTIEKLILEAVFCMKNGQEKLELTTSHHALKQDYYTNIT